MTVDEWDFSDSIARLLQRNAVKWPERVMATFESGEEWTWRDAWDAGVSAATAFRSYGLAEGSHVGILLENGMDWLRAWFGTALLGGVIVPFVTAHRGQVLSDMVRRGSCRAVVTNEGLLPRLSAADADIQIIRSDELRSHGGAARAHDATVPAASGWDLHALICTSGTTGASKAVEISNCFLMTTGEWWQGNDLGVDLSEDDVFQCDLSLAHLTALSASVQMMRLGGRINVRARPDLSNYWAVARDGGSTFAIVLGTMSQYLQSRPPSEDDRAHRMRALAASPLMEDPEAFMNRFGIDTIVTTYGSTEASVSIVRNAAWNLPARSCGRLRSGVEARIVDAHDVEVPTGQPGELVLRRSRPWTATSGYYGDPEATVELYRNGWLHSGDMLSTDERGNFYFHDRIKDSLRRRGENVSSFEVERELLAHPDVLEAACVGAKDETGDDEIRVFVVKKPGSMLDAPSLLKFLVERVAHFMVPRYFQFVDELPKTATGRVKKFELRTREMDSQTWDFVAAGYELSRKGLSERDPISLEANARA